MPPILSSALEIILILQTMGSRASDLSGKEGRGKEGRLLCQRGRRDVEEENVLIAASRDPQEHSIFWALDQRLEGLGLQISESV